MPRRSDIASGLSVVLFKARPSHSLVHTACSKGAGTPLNFGEAITSSTLVPLAMAASLYFPGGVVKVSTLRVENRKGLLVPELIGNKHFVTRAAIEAWRGKCRVQPKGPRLYLKRFKTGPAWIIRDGSIERGTGCGAGERATAERALGEYIAKKHRPDYSDGNPANVKIGDVLVSYGNECSDPVAIYALPKLVDHFAGKTLANITPKECQGYVAQRCSQPIAAAKDKATAKRVATGTARRELEVLSGSGWSRLSRGPHQLSGGGVVAPQATGPRSLSQQKRTGAAAMGGLAQSASQAPGALYPHQPL